jgi:hypothetical protein
MRHSAMAQCIRSGLHTSGCVDALAGVRQVRDDLAQGNDTSYTLEARDSVCNPGTQLWPHMQHSMPALW